MMLSAVCVVLIALLGTAEGQVFGGSIHESKFDCAGKANGVAEIGCDGYLECFNNAPVKHFCENYQFFDRDTMSCVNTSDGQSGCTKFNVCAHLDDGSYADPENNCQTYYTCHAYHFYGHQYCPAGLVFDMSMQLCNWPVNVLFPCGTLKPTPDSVG